MLKNVGLILFLLGLTKVCSGEQLIHSAILDSDGKFHLSWTPSSEFISFEAVVETKGYVAVGFSPNGGMTGSDIVIAWVDDATGVGKISDRHAVAKSTPITDKEQDYELISSSQNDTHTTVRFKRKLNLCGEEDHYLTAETVRLIWAYNPSDPADGEPSYHGNNRGTKSIFLLNPQVQVPGLPADYFHYDFLNPNVTMPNKDTTYWCQAFDVPQLNGKHHAIKIEPVIQPGMEPYVHHILLYGCFHEISNQTVPGMGHECYSPNMPADFAGCTAVVYSWAIGGGAFYLPENVGLPFGYAGDPTMILMETHYDNPTMQSGLVDASGLRMTLTPSIRQHDAGILEMGVSVGPNHFIPPYSERFTTNGHCVPECLKQAMEGNQDSLKIFGYMLHTHLMGIALRVRHFRKGNELEMIAADNNYDFNFQEARLTPKEVEVLPGDHFIVECDYRTDKLTSVTYGGLSTREEMCLGFVMYYPKIPLSNCQSSITYPKLATHVGAVAENTGVLTSPPEYAGQFINNYLQNGVDWTDKSVRNTLEAGINEEGVNGYYGTCTNGKTYYSVSLSPIALSKTLSSISTDRICGGALDLNVSTRFSVAFVVGVYLFMVL